jgi:hypothetical protein
MGGHPPSQRTATEGRQKAKRWQGKKMGSFYLEKREPRERRGIFDRINRIGRENAQKAQNEKGFAHG